MPANKIALALNIPIRQVNATLHLLGDGATIPFIARYRKDITGGLNEIQIADIQDALNTHNTLEARRISIIKSLSEKDLLTPALERALLEAESITILEDIYAPYKSKRKTRADIAVEQGLEPLSKLILIQGPIDPRREAKNYFNDKVKDIDAALQGARDIIAEQVSDDVDLKAQLRSLFGSSAIITSKVIKTKINDAAKFKDYFDYSEGIKKLANHRFLAINRGVNEGFLRSSIDIDTSIAHQRMARKYIKNQSSSAEQVMIAIEDAYKRLIQPSLENEMRTELKARADKDAIEIFSKNLSSLLLASPLGEKCVLAIDPGYRTGCKVVVLDPTGKLLDTAVIYIHEAQKLDASAKTIRHLGGQYGVEAIAVGDGTGGRETEQFIKRLQLNLPVFLVNEDGASIYSASTLAREEFPDLDLTFRGAVSIGRRLMDPLAELVKIDPKSIGVGQYQHDVNQTRLKEKLDQTVEFCVNSVGVNINTASKYLLSFVSGIGPTLADNIIKYRNEWGGFKHRQQLMKVPRLGSKVFEQAAGFLRIKDGENKLDASGVHPESYPLVHKIAKQLNVNVSELFNHPKLKDIDPNGFVDATTGLHTINDIINELKKPGQDPRSDAETFEYANIQNIDQLHEGMVLPGQVTNLTNFGAFVNIGIKEGGMVHISEIVDRFIKDPAKVLSIGQKVNVRVLSIDKSRNRIQLSIKKA